jgi:phage gp16-like protein
MPGTDPDRNRELAAIHVGKKKLALEDDEYRELLFQETGKRSARDLDFAGRQRVLDRFRALGFTPPVRRRNPSANKQHSKIRFLWRDLYRAGGIRNNSDKALDSYVKRMTGKDALRFIDDGEAWRVIEALKLWLARAEGSR